MIKNDKKRIAIIAHPLHAGGGISVGRNFIAALGQVSPENQYLVSIPSDLGYEAICDDFPHFQTHIFSGKSNLYERWWWETRVLRPTVKKFNPDLVIALANKGLGGMTCPEAILCHNSYVWYPSKNYGVRSLGNMVVVKAKIWFQRRSLQGALKKSHNILLHQTRTARDRIAHTFDLRAHAILCPNAVSKFATISDQLLIMPEKMQSYSGRFKMLFVTRYYPHKNLETIVELFRNHRDELGDCAVFLTISNEHGAGAKKLIDSIHHNGLQDHIINVGPLKQEELGAWFHHSNALLMPTLLESFSGTYLESMHFETPILTSDLDFAREICQDAAIYFDPWNTASIRDAIVKLRDNPNQAVQLRKYGKQRLGEMQNSWTEIVKNLLHKINEVVSD